jgi:CRISPR system Cascade subunit CasD
MSVLRLRLAGPMQSWGTQSRFSVRDAGLEPSKSGVIGLLCAALGRPRALPVTDLAALTMAVRVDREGSLARDFHTAKDVVRADGSGLAETVISSRYYLADADFLVLLQGERALLEDLDAALRRPVWPLYLGRKSFLPGLPVAWQRPQEAVVEDELQAVLGQTPWHPRRREVKARRPPRYVSDVPLGAGEQREPRQDVPLSFELRTFAVRHVHVGFCPDIPPHCQSEDADHVPEQTAS